VRSRTQSREDKILEALDQKDDGANIALVSQSSIDLDVLLIVDVVQVCVCVTFITTHNLAMSPEFSPAYQECVNELMSSLSKGGVGSVISLQDILGRVCDVVYHAIPLVLVKCSQLVADVLAIGAQAKSPEASINLSKGVFDDTKTMERVVRARTNYIVDLLSKLVRGKHRVTGHDYDAICSGWNNSLDSIAVVDAALVGSAPWRHFWIGLLKHVHDEGLLTEVEAKCMAWCKQHQPVNTADVARIVSPPEPAQDDTGDARPKFTSIVNMRASLRPDGESVSGPIIPALASHLQKFICEVAMQGVRPANTQKDKQFEMIVQPDSKLVKVGTLGFGGSTKKSEKSRLFYKGPMPDEFSATFVGKVVRAGQKGALPICLALGTQFFLVSNGSPITNDQSCLALHLPIQKEKKNNRTGAVTGDERSLIVNETVHIMPFEYFEFFDQKVVDISVSVYSLVKNPEFGQVSDDEYVRLQRPLYREAVQGQPKLQSKVAQRTAAVKQSCKHLLRSVCLSTRRRCGRPGCSTASA